MTDETANAKYVRLHRTPVNEETPEGEFVHPRNVIKILFADNDRMLIYAGDHVIGDIFVGQMSGAEWVGAVAATLIRFEFDETGGNTPLVDLAIDVTTTLERAF